MLFSGKKKNVRFSGGGGGGVWWRGGNQREREMFYLTTHSTHFIYGYMASDIWLRTILIVRKETSCRHIGYSYRLTARVILYAPSHRQDNTYHGLCYTSRGALAGTRNSSMGPPHEGWIRRPIAPWANALPLSYVPLLGGNQGVYLFTLFRRPSTLEVIQKITWTASVFAYSWTFRFWVSSRSYQWTWFNMGYLCKLKPIQITF